MGPLQLLSLTVTVICALVLFLVFDLFVLSSMAGRQSC
jgi:hypothetical protein